MQLAPMRWNVYGGEKPILDYSSAGAIVGREKSSGRFRPIGFAGREKQITFGVHSSDKPREE